jgi:hypothetical protein
VKLFDHTTKGAFVVRYASENDMVCKECSISLCSAATQMANTRGRLPSSSAPRGNIGTVWTVGAFAFWEAVGTPGTAMLECRFNLCLSATMYS